MNDNIEQEYYNYISDYIKSEIDNNFEYSIDNLDIYLLNNYSDALIQRVCSNVTGISDNPNIKEYLLNELSLATYIGYVFNSASNRFSLEDPKNSTFVERKKTFKVQYTLKEKIIIFLLKVLNKKIQVVE